jgi:hypothetical protein
LRKEPSKLPAVLTRIAHPDYVANGSTDQMLADLNECHALRQFVRENYGQSSYESYLLALDSLCICIEARGKLAALQAAEQSALQRLDASYDRQQQNFVN